MTQTLTLLKNLISFIDSQYDLESISDLDIAIQVLDQIFAESVSTFGKKIDQLTSILEICLSEHPSVQLLTISHLFGFIIDVVENFPKLGKNKVRCAKLLRFSINIFVKIPLEIQDSWYNPPNGYSEGTENNADLMTEKEIMRNFDGFCQSVGRNTVSSSFQLIFKEYIQNTTDWRYPYAALMLASQLCGDKSTVDFLHPYIQSAVLLLEHPHPKVRFASFQMIGQYGDDLKPQFQEKYYDFVVPAMVKHLSDPVPRVVSHDLACFTNFFEDIHEVWKIQSIIGQVLPPIFQCLQTSNTLLKQNAVSTLSSFASTQDAFGPYLTQILQAAIQLINKYAGVPQFTQTINQTIELLSFILVYQRKSQVQQHVQNFIQLLFTQKDNISSSYLLTAWSRLCSRYDAFISINHVFDILMQATKNVLENQGDQEVVQAISALNFTCQSFKVNLITYVQRLINFSKQVFQDKSWSVDIRQSSIGLIVKSITETHCQTPEIFNVWKEFAKNSILYVINSIQSVEQNYEEYVFLYQALSHLIKISSTILNQSFVHDIAAKVHAYQNKIQNGYKNLSQRKKILEQQCQGQQVNQDEIQAKEIQKMLDSLACGIQNIPQIYKAFYSIQAPGIRQWLLQHLLKEANDYIDKTGEWKLLGLNISVVIGQTATYEEIKDVWPNLLNLYINNSSNPHTRIRNSAIYGFGLIIQRLPTEIVTQQNVYSWLQTLWSAFTAPYEQDLDEDLMEHSNDNIVSTLGKILFKYGSKFPVLLNQQIYKHWVSKLPLNNDKIQGDIQQRYLINLLNSNPGMIVSNAQDLKQICVIYASFLLKRHDHKDIIMQETKESFRAITKWPLFKESENYLWNNLKASHINLLTRFLAS